jgi:hypothetical protein
VSVDIDTVEVGRRLGIDQPAGQYVTLPLAVIPKGLLLDFDLTDAEGRPLPVLSRAVDSRVGTDVVMAAISRGSGRPLAAIPAELRARIEELVYNFLDPEESVSELWAAMEDEWTPWIDSEVARRWLRALTEGFLLMTELRLEGGRQILKYRRLEIDSDDDADFLRLPQSDHWYQPRRWPFYPRRPSYPVVVRAGGPLHAESEHVRVIAPRGTFFAAPAILTAIPRADDALELDYSARIGGDRAVFNLRRGHAAMRPPIYFVGALLPDMRGFRLPVGIYMALAAFALLAGGTAESVWGFLSRLQDALDPAVAILLLIPTVFLAYILREGEHAARRRLLSLLRGLALVSLVPLFSGALVLFIDADLLLGWVVAATWLVAGVIDGVLAIWFWALTRRIHDEARFSDSLAVETTEWTIETSAEPPL